MDIASTQRLAAYTRDLGIDRARGAADPKATSSAASRRAQASKSADQPGVQVSLSTNAMALTTGNNAESLQPNRAEADPLVQSQADTKPREIRSNRSLAIAAYQKIDSSIPGRRIQVVA